MASSLRCSWQPDTSTTICKGCHKKFALLRRRHHCRACGDIFCDPCTPHRLEHVAGYDSAVRVCKSCFRVSKRHPQSIEGTVSSSKRVFSFPPSGDLRTMSEGQGSRQPPSFTGEAAHGRFSHDSYSSGSSGFGTPRLAFLSDLGGRADSDVVGPVSPTFTTKGGATVSPADAVLHNSSLTAFEVEVVFSRGQSGSTMTLRYDVGEVETAAQFTHRLVKQFWDMEYGLRRRPSRDDLALLAAMLTLRIETSPTTLQPGTLLRQVMASGHRRFLVEKATVNALAKGHLGSDGPLLSTSSYGISEDPVSFLKPGTAFAV